MTNASRAFKCQEHSSGKSVQVARAFKWQEHPSGKSVQVARAFKWQEHSSGKSIQVARVFKWQERSSQQFKKRPCASKNMNEDIYFEHIWKIVAITTTNELKFCSTKQRGLILPVCIRAKRKHNVEDSYVWHCAQWSPSW